MACNIFCNTNSLWHEGGGEVVGHVPVTGRDLLHLGLRLVELRRLDILVTLEHGALVKGATLEEVVDHVSADREGSDPMLMSLRSELLPAVLNVAPLTQDSYQHIHRRRCPS